MKLKVLNHERQYKTFGNGGKMLEEPPSNIYLDNAEGGYCLVCSKEKPPPMLTYEPEDGAYSMGICKECLVSITKQLNELE